MGISREYRDFVEDLLAGFGPVTIRAMFGGAGIFHDGIMFVIIADETLYLKVDNSNRPDFEAEGMSAFTYSARGKSAEMSYREVPERLYDEPEEFAEWARKAFKAAFAAKQGKRGA
jgi:DNA transformation protein